MKYLDYVFVGRKYILGFVKYYLSGVYVFS